MATPGSFYCSFTLTKTSYYLASLASRKTRSKALLAYFFNIHLQKTESSDHSRSLVVFWYEIVLLSFLSGIFDIFDIFDILDIFCVSFFRYRGADAADAAGFSPLIF